MRTTITDDETLLRAVAEGDRAALRVLYERHAPWLTLRLTRRCPDPDLVDDAVQDTFVAVWRTAKRYDGHGAVGAWIWGIGVRRLIDAHPPPPAARVPDPRAARGAPSAEEQVLLDVAHGDLGGALRPAVAGAARGRAGDRPRRADHPRGGAAAGHPGRHGQDAHDCARAIQLREELA